MIEASEHSCTTVGTGNPVDANQVQTAYLAALNGAFAKVQPAQAIVADPPSLYAARALDGQVPVVDLNSLICGPRDCDPVVGNVLVFFDSHHLTNSYGQTMAPYVRERLLAASPLLRQDGAAPRSGQA